MNRIALVEDHERLSTLVRKALAAAGIEVDVFDRIASARHAITETPYGAVVVDRGLPDGDGLSLVRRMRADGNVTPCLMLTARDAVHDRVEGLEAGADDYLAKPFSMEELAARVRALLRRPAAMQSLTPSHGDIRLAPDQGNMSCGDETVTLPSAELQIMLCLVKAEGMVVRRAALEAAAWGLTEAVTPNALDVALHRLRKKLLAIDSTLQVINVRGHGYALRSDAQ
ncbi:MAG: response regulator transcription factor [Burkholderiales bacterium]|nr:response regulator transcription factor [Burkholderiales bacterium]